MKLLELSTEL